MIQIWREGITWVNQLIKLLLQNDVNESKIRQRESMDIKFIGAISAGVGTSEQEQIDLLANGIKIVHPPSIHALLRALIGKLCESVALAVYRD